MHWLLITQKVFELFISTLTFCFALGEKHEQKDVEYDRGVITVQDENSLEWDLGQAEPDWALQ